MIREFEKGDEEKLKPNEFSESSDVADVFLDDSFVKHTLDDEGEVRCIICWKQYAPKQYAIFFLMEDGIKFKHARALKRFLDSATEKLKPKSCITYSFDCDMLNRWHKFFGFEKQRGVIFDGGVNNYNKWAIKWV